MVGLGNVVGDVCIQDVVHFSEIRNICLYCKRRRKRINRD